MLHTLQYRTSTLQCSCLFATATLPLLAFWSPIRTDGTVRVVVIDDDDDDNAGIRCLCVHQSVFYYERRGIRGVAVLNLAIPVTLRFPHYSFPFLPFLPSFSFHQDSLFLFGAFLLRFTVRPSWFCAVTFCRCSSSVLLARSSVLFLVLPI